MEGKGSTWARLLPWLLLLLPLVLPLPLPMLFGLLLLLQHAPSHVIPFFALAVAAASGEVELDGATAPSTSSPLTYEAVESLISKAMEGLPQRLSVCYCFCCCCCCCGSYRCC